jgi:hypothetical protein
MAASHGAGRAASQLETPCAVRPWTTSNSRWRSRSTPSPRAARGRGGTARDLGVLAGRWSCPTRRGRCRRGRSGDRADLAADGQPATRNAARHQTKLALLRFTDRALLDAIGSWFGRPPLVVPLAGTPGTVAALTTPDSLEGAGALDPHGRYPDWQQEAAARSVLGVGFYRPGRAASRIQCPLLLVVACEDDQTALGKPARRIAKRAPRAELVVMPGGHYEPFLAGFEHAVSGQIDSSVATC